MNRPRSVMTTKPVGDEGRAVFDRLFARVFTRLLRLCGGLCPGVLDFHDFLGCGWSG